MLKYDCLKSKLLSKLPEVTMIKDP